MRPCLIALDLDGTSVRYEPRLEMHPELIALLDKHRADGVQWLMNSDRPTAVMVEIAMHLHPEQRPVAILSRQQEIHLQDGGEYAPHMEFNSRYNRLHRALWEMISPNFSDWAQAIHHEFKVLESFVDQDGLAFRVPQPQMDRLRIVMNEMLTPWPEARLSGNNDWCFVVHEAFSKRVLLAEILRVLRIGAHDLLAIGDGINDLSMLDGSLTPHVGCPANACDEVQEIIDKAGGYRAALPDAHGTIQVIEHYLDPASS